MAGILTSMAGSPLTSSGILGGQSFAPSFMPVQQVNPSGIPAVPAPSGANPVLQQLVAGIGKSLMSQSAPSDAGAAQASQMAQQQQMSMAAARARMQQAAAGGYGQANSNPFRTQGF